ncbi:MAG: hypothetical protein ACK5AY_07330 [Bacteroidota bacterium]|jgi:hypothetical protein
MRKLIPVVFGSLAIFSLISCKKDRVCECSRTSATSGATTTYKVTFFDSRKSDARKLCSSESYQVQYLTPTAELDDKTICELK